MIKEKGGYISYQDRINAQTARIDKLEERITALEAAYTRPRPTHLGLWTAKRMCKEAGHPSNLQAAEMLKAFAMAYSKKNNLPVSANTEAGKKAWLAFTEEAAKHAIAQVKEVLG